MNDSIETLALLSEEQKQQLLEFYRSLPESEEALDELTQTPSRSGKRLWTDSPELVAAVDAFLWSIMGDDSPYQFANSTQLYQAYRKIQDQYAPYNEYLGGQYFKFFVRKWIEKNGRDWEEKSQTKRNRVFIRFPNGYMKTNVAGFGRKQLVNANDDPNKTFPRIMVELDTVWNSAAFYAAAK